MSAPTVDRAAAYLTLPLAGVQAIEASAGTGKTFTLATLVLRLVLERGLGVERILAVTFTEAATQELRARVRKRLILAAEVAAGEMEAAASPEAALTAALIAAHLHASDESPPRLARRLRAAADRIDQAAVFTIHGFCTRVLREHALESGQGFDPPELLASDRGLRDAIAADLWRAHGRDAESVDDLQSLWSQGPAALAADLATLVREPVLRPEPQAGLPDPTPMLHAAAAHLRESTRMHAEDFRGALLAAVAAKVLNGSSYKAAWIEDLFTTLRRWCEAGDMDAPFEHPKLDQLHRARLLERTSKAGAGRTPDSPLAGAFEDYARALAAIGDWRQARQVSRLHVVREDARKRLAVLKRQLRVQTYDDLIDRVADALDGPQGDALAARLREQYAVALVDEFQDTDPRQWAIFDRVFGRDSAAPALFVIGDPKQAIYGFRGGDVETYLDARATAEEAPPLAHNFRSRPAVLEAIEALYAQAGAQLAAKGRADGGDDATSPFLDSRIRFHPVQPGGTRSDDAFLRDGVVAPALTLWQAPPTGEVDAKGKPKPHGAPRSRELATVACVAAIHAVLSDARAGIASIDRRAVQPGDIAVLVRTHREATTIRDALAAVGIPAVAAGKQSLFATSEARELLALLRALLHGGDDGRLRAALCTVLVGQDAHHVAALDADGARLRHWQAVALGWRERLQQGGPLALVNVLCAQEATRLLALVDGERRLTNYLQLGEQLQEAQRGALGLHGLVDWLERAISEASADDEAQLLRLESDARRVQVVTLHKSKGLEYPLVFLPYVGIGGKPPVQKPGKRVVVVEGGTRVLHWPARTESIEWKEAHKAWLKKEAAEDARLLYVGLTRARDALWLAMGPLYRHEKSPLWSMVADPAALLARAGGSAVLDTAEPPAALPWLGAQAQDAVPAARTPTRSLLSDWWVYSFTQLAHADGGADTSSAATQPAPGGRDEPADDGEDAALAQIRTDDGYDPRFGGARFGVVLHEVFEHTDFGAWQGWQPGEPAPDDARAGILEALGNGGYAADEIEAGSGLLTELAGRTLTVALPEGLRLADLPPAQRRPEIEFQFALAPTRVDALLALLQRHGLLHGRQGFGSRRRLEGLMTGLIDLTYVHDGRWYVLDYKSNRLPGYGAAQMALAMDHSEYGLQALIYTLALHRWLRFRLGAGYDYARDFGGVRYLFCRGLDPADASAPGVQAWRFAPELVDALDALFAGRDGAGNAGAAA